MKQLVFCAAGSSPALEFAQKFLQLQGRQFLPGPGESVTHLLLPVPSFDPAGVLKGGGDLHQILKDLPGDITILGGGLDKPCLQEYRTVDLLKDPVYLAQNAAITAQCAVRLMLWNLTADIRALPVLIIGWGRIGKCLAALLKAMGAQVSICARKENDRAMAKALGYGAENPEKIGAGLQRYRVIFNTAPAHVFDDLRCCRGDCIKIDLASIRGLPGDDVIWARGLPGRDAPEASGRLIAQTVLRLTNLEG